MDILNHRISEETHHIKQVLVSGREIASQVVSLRYVSRYDLLCEMYGLVFDAAFERVLFAHLAFSGMARDDAAPERELDGNSRRLYMHLIDNLSVPELGAALWLSKPLCDGLLDASPAYHVAYAKFGISNGSCGGRSERGHGWVIAVVEKTLRLIESF